MKKAIQIARQGDVNFYQIEEFPDGDRLKDKQCEDAILAYGEISGHCHEVEDKASVEVFKILGDLYMNVLKDVTVRHGKIKNWKGNEADKDYHSEIVIPKGKYFIGITEETDHLGQTVRRVVD